MKQQLCKACDEVVINHSRETQIHDISIVKGITQIKKEKKHGYGILEMKTKVVRKSQHSKVSLPGILPKVLYYLNCL